MSTKKITEALTSKKAATASKLFAEEMEARLDEISKKTLGRYIERAVADRDRHIEDATQARASADALSNVRADSDEATQTKRTLRSYLGHQEREAHAKKYKREYGVLKALNRLTKEDLDEVEAPANFWNAGMAKMNPIQVSQKQPAEPGQFKATLTKSPTRLADQDSSLEGKPRAVRDETETVAASRGPKTIELTGDWQADVPDHDFDPKLDSETEFYPLFSQFKAMGAYPSGPARAWEETEINESEDFDHSYRGHPAFVKTFGKNHPAEKTHDEQGYTRYTHHLTHGNTEHAAEMVHFAGKYHAHIHSQAYGNRRVGEGIAETSHEAFDKAHKAYKENYKMPEYMKEGELNELSKKTLASYVGKAADDSRLSAYAFGHSRGSNNNGPDVMKDAVLSHKRQKGIEKAAKKLSEDSASLMATATKDEKKAAEQDKKKPSEFKKLHDKHETEVKAKMKELGEEALDEISKNVLKSYLKKAKSQKRGLSVKIDNDFKKMQHATDWSPESEAMKAANRTNSISRKYHTRNSGIQKATKKLSENALEEGLFDPAKQPLLALWDEHARRTDAHGSGSRNEILKRIEDHVSKKYGQEGLKKMHLHTDLTNTLKHSLSPDKGHLQALLGNMRAKCAQGA